MPSIDTLRLRIFPLTPEQVRLWVEDLPALERELGYSYRGIPLEERPLEALRQLLAQAEGPSPSRGWRISPPRPIWSAIPPSGSWSGWASRSTAMRKPCGGAYENLGRGSRRGTNRPCHL